jgi:transcriptional regulator with XRE-family HTH domain
MQLTPVVGIQNELNSVWERGALPLRQRITASQEPDALRANKASVSAFIARKGQAAVIAFLVGTGGLATADYIAGRDQRGYRFEGIEYRGSAPSIRSTQLDLRSPVDNLARVREVFVPSVTDLASLFNVSRQTIYNWQSGETIAPENADRLERLARAADHLAEHSLGQKLSVLRRRISNGKNFFELVKSGADAESIARTLVNTIEREFDQRQRLNARLGNRPRRPVDPADLGTPHLDESV